MDRFDCLLAPCWFVETDAGGGSNPGEANAQSGNPISRCLLCVADGETHDAEEQAAAGARGRGGRQKRWNWIGDHQPVSRTGPSGAPQVRSRHRRACSKCAGPWIINLIRRGHHQINAAIHRIAIAQAH
jgi:hypothetical protein